MSERSDEPERGDLTVRLAAFALAQVAFFWSSDGLQSWRDFAALLYFNLFFFYVFLLRFVWPAAIPRYAGAFFGFLFAEFFVLRPPELLDDGPALALAIALPVGGQIAWMLFNRIPAVQRANARREAAIKDNEAALARVSAAKHAPAGTGTMADAERGGAGADPPIDVAGLARELDEIRRKK
jgi:hypothetical protein